VHGVRTSLCTRAVCFLLFEVAVELTPPRLALSTKEWYSFQASPMAIVMILSRPRNLVHEIWSTRIFRDSLLVCLLKELLVHCSLSLLLTSPLSSRLTFEATTLTNNHNNHKLGVSNSNSLTNRFFTHNVLQNHNLFSVLQIWRSEPLDGYTEEMLGEGFWGGFGGYECKCSASFLVDFEH
jgi:hypothetical protein